MFCAYNSLGTPSTVTSTFVILRLKNSSVSRVNSVAHLSFVKMSNTPLKLFDVNGETSVRIVELYNASSKDSIL